VRLAEVHPGDYVIEVGAGLGTLTLELANAAKRVLAIEVDHRLIPALTEVVGKAGNVEVVEANAMDLDFSALTQGRPHRFISNLPYNIATPLVAGLLESAPEIGDFAIMLQREVGDRLVAKPGSKTYGAVSVLVAYHCETRILGNVPATVFWPRPKVASVLVGLRRRLPPVDIEYQQLMKVVRASFAQRRKTARNSIAAILGLPAAEVATALAEAEVDADARAESLSLAEFASIAKALQ
jgi:16S rRNA (adenine1518-N6/adenine1519-N6)-dimethyltransferase